MFFPEKYFSIYFLIFNKLAKEYYYKSHLNVIQQNIKGPDRVGSEGQVVWEKTMNLETIFQLKQFFFSIKKNYFAREICFTT